MSVGGGDGPADPRPWGRQAPAPPTPWIGSYEQAVHLASEIVVMIQVRPPKLL